MISPEQLLNIASHFDLEGEPLVVKQLGDGFINDTYIVTMKNTSRRYLLQRKNTHVFKDIPGMMKNTSRRYLLQRKNTHVFKDIPGMMNNISLITSHLKKKIIALGGNPEREALTVIPSRDGKLYHEENGEYWCVTIYIEGSVTYTDATTPKLAEQGGKGIGKFQAMLSDFNEPLTDTLPGFHNIMFRFSQWDASLAKDPANRAKSVKHLIAEIDARRDEMTDFYKLIESGQIPKRVTHNDTKIANILFDGNDDVLCVIDLDTVLQAPCLYDFGDSIRSYANTGMEDDPKPENVSMSMEMYEAYMRGYLSEADAFLTDIEREYLPFSAKYITYEQVLRFLMDYIDGDTYYKIKYPEHNHVRTVSQLALLRSIEQRLRL